MTGNNPLLEVVIPNWNGRNLLKICLESLCQQTYRNFRILVVDNGSEDGSVEFINQYYPDVAVISLSANTGFSHAVNIGINSGSAPWILLLNNDVEVARDCLEMLVRGIERYPEYHFFSLKMVNYHHRELLDGAGDAVLRGGAGYRIGTMEHDGGFYSVDRESFGGCGGAVLYSREFFARAGSFDEDFFAYLEDVDLNLRARRLGLCCRYLASAIVYHMGSATTGTKFNPLTIRLSTRNSIYVLAKNYSPNMLLRCLGPILVYQLMWFAFCVKKRMVRPYLLGVGEAIRNIPLFLRKRRAFCKRDDLLSEGKFLALVAASEDSAIDSIMARRKENGKGNTLLKIYKKLFL